MVTVGTVVAMFGVVLSAMLPIAVIFVPIYLLFIKPRIDKYYKFNTIPATVQSNKLGTVGNGKKNLLLEPCTSIPTEDLAYLAKVLSPDSTHMDILIAVITTPENIEWSVQDLTRAIAIKQDRIEKDKVKARKTGGSGSSKNKINSIATAFDDLVNEDGWADDDNNNNNDGNTNQVTDAEIRARQAEEERKADMERLRVATGQAVQLLEGIDPGVIGQEWVERTLASHGVWPVQDLRFISNTLYEYTSSNNNNSTKQNLSPLNHPGIRRMLCMTVGRLNSLYLNGHPELLEAGSKKLIDQTYFRSSMEFRNRIAVVLEGALRVGMLVRSSRLVSTVIETTCMFKIGTMSNPKSISWFNNLMMKQYNVLPRIEISNGTIQTPTGVGGSTDGANKADDDTSATAAGGGAGVVEYEKDVVCGDISDVQFDIHRIHADNFLRQKVDMFDKQGIPPEVGLSTYREAWWFLVQMKRLDGPTPSDDDGLFSKSNPMLMEMKIPLGELQKFELENIENRLITAWPLIIQNVAQKMGKMKIVFQAPNVPGKYRYTIKLKSAEFLDADSTFDIDIQVIDSKTAKRDARKNIVQQQQQNQNQQQKNDETNNKNKSTTSNNTPNNNSSSN